MASLTRWTWVWASSGSWWWTGKPGVLQSTGSQRVGHDWATELNSLSFSHFLWFLKKENFRNFSQIEKNFQWRHFTGIFWLQETFENQYNQYWCWSWSSNTLVTWCKELTHWKRPWCWERLRARGEGGDRGWVGWMASLTQWIWVWASSVKDREAWHAAVHGVKKSQTWLSNWATIIYTKETKI